MSFYAKQPMVYQKDTKKQAASEAGSELKRGSEANHRARRAKQGVPAPAGCLPHSKTASGERSKPRDQAGEQSESSRPPSEARRPGTSRVSTTQQNSERRAKRAASKKHRPPTVFCQGVRGDFEFCKERTREHTPVCDRESDASKARNPPQSRQKKWSQLSDLNRRPGDYKSTALPTELSWHLNSVAIQYSKNRNLQTFS